MDQPTNIKITIKGMKEDVKRAGFSAQRRMDRDTRGFKERDYVIGSGSYLEEMVENSIAFLPNETEEMSRKKAQQRTNRIKKTVCMSAIALILIVVVLVVNFGRKDNLETAKVGKKVWFGRYEQDCDDSNGKEKIEWIVLAKEEDRILLLSKYALDCKTYHKTFEDVTWEECTLRRWLNDDFMNAAFSDEEKNKIATVTVSVEQNSYYDGNPGNATLDKIFLLSISEANQYFSSDIQRQCKATKYAKTQGIYENEVTGHVWWWLRSPGYLLGYAPCVRSIGSVDEYGHKVDTNNNAVRPALWVKLES